MSLKKPAINWAIGLLQSDALDWALIWEGISLDFDRVRFLIPPFTTNFTVEKDGPIPPFIPFQLAKESCLQRHFTWPI